MARGASSTGKGVRRAAPDRQARVGVQEWVWWGSARAGRRRDSGRSHIRVPVLVVTLLRCGRSEFWPAAVNFDQDEQ